MPVNETSQIRTTAGVYGANVVNGDGVFGYGKDQGRGVVGVSENHTGVEGNSVAGTGMWATSDTGRALAAWSNSGQAVYGHSKTQAGVVGESDTFDAVFGISHNPKASAISGHNPGGQAGFFDGNVIVTGNINVVGDVLLTGADCAEDFDVVATEVAEPGTVMVMNDCGALTASCEAYDRKVVGVISGAGSHRPAIVMDKRQGDARATIALMGKVYCKVDADIAPVLTGDMMTTSPTTGHAMKASDPTQAFGAVIGKALRSLPNGKGLIPLLVALQ